jgi:hypothetical protein
MFRRVRRRIPWMLAFEAALVMREHWQRLPPHDRTRMAELARRSGGRWGRLTPDERADFRRIAKNLDLFGLARGMMPFGRRFGGRRH